VWWIAETGSTRTGARLLVVDPPDGRVPPLDARGAEAGDEDRAASDAEKFAGVVARLRRLQPLHLRSALPRLSTGYNNNYEIVQAPGLVAIVQSRCTRRG